MYDDEGRFAPTHGVLGLPDWITAPLIPTRPGDAPELIAEAEAILARYSATQAAASAADRLTPHDRKVHLMSPDNQNPATPLPAAPQTPQAGSANLPVGLIPCGEQEVTKQLDELQMSLGLRSHLPFWFDSRRPKAADGVVKWKAKNTDVKVALPPVWDGPRCDDYAAAVRNAGMLSARAALAEQTGRTVEVALAAVGLLVATSAIVFATDLALADPATGPLLIGVGLAAAVILVFALVSNRNSDDAGWLRALAFAWEQEAGRLAQSDPGTVADLSRPEKT